MVGQLRIVIPCHSGDQHQAERLLKWIAELGKVNAKGFLCCARDCKVESLMQLMGEAFTETKWLEDAENIKSDWSAPHDNPKSAEGPNSIFKQVSWYFSLKDQNPWLFLEPDAFPVCRDWYDRMSKEWELAVKEGKQFVGASVSSPGSPVPTHMSGVAIYHPQTPAISNAAVNNGKIAFDIAGAKDFMPRARFTNVIVHKFRGPEFDSQRDLDKHCPEGTVIYHASKSGSILHWLRLRLGMEGIWPSEVSETFSVKTIEDIRSAIVEHGVVSDEPVCDIYIKTWERDFPWLDWCLKSLMKNARWFRNIIIESEVRPNSELAFQWHQSVDRTPGYLWQQSCKLEASKRTDADYILYMDSDCVLTREVSPSDFLKDGKPIWQYTPFENARDDQSVWIGPMEKFVGKRPGHEFMRRHPFFVPRWALEEMQKFCFYRHGKTLPDYIMDQAVPNSPLALTFSEWNCLGFFLHEFHRDKFTWVLDSEASPAICWQGHTHAGEARMNQDLAQMREIVEGAPEPLLEPEKPAQTISEQIRTHVAALREIVMESKVGRTQMLHQELRAAGLLGPAQKRKVERNEMAVV